MTPEELDVIHGKVQKYKEGMRILLSAHAIFDSLGVEVETTILTNPLREYLEEI